MLCVCDELMLLSLVSTEFSLTLLTTFRPQLKLPVMQQTHFVQHWTLVVCTMDVYKYLLDTLLASPVMGKRKPPIGGKKLPTSVVDTI